MQLQLPWAPQDTVSHCSFHPNAAQCTVLVASWDSRVKIYIDSTLAFDYSQPGPVLAACFLPNDPLTGGLRVVSAGADTKIYAFNSIHQEKGAIPIGKALHQHSDTVKCLAYDPQSNLLVSASWDCTLRTWNEAMEFQASLTLPSRPHAMSVHEGKAVVACDDKTIYIVQLSTLSIIQQRTSSLRHPTRAIVCFPEKEQLIWCTSSTEGRVAIDWLQTPEKRYAFKCHRRIGAEGAELVYPVNALAVYPRIGEGGIFATGGSDGTVCIWSREGKRKIKTLPPFPTTISQVAFSADGKWLAVAASYVWDQGEERESVHSVHVYPMYASELGVAER